MINLFINPFTPKSSERDAEYKQCIAKNEDNKFIDRIIRVEEEKNATYRDFLNAMREFPDDVNIMANLDIYFDETVRLTEKIKYSQVYAITRHEVTTGQIFTHMSPRDSWNSQDVWVFRGAPVEDVKFVRQSGWWPFPLGVGGCDNHFAWLLNRVGYRLVNPAHSIKCWHVHSAGFNNREWHGQKRVGTRKMYMVIKPSII